MRRPLLCRWGWHRWRYHDHPISIRVCVSCLLRQRLREGEWV